MFEKIIGNEKIKQELINLAKNNKYPHSMLFIGTEGIGKKIFAEEFAKMILCEKDSFYCNKCKSCLEFESNNHPDFIEIIPDGNNVKIDQIREIQRKVAEPPIISKRKVYIIDNADMMTKEAQNALLKTLEEPPEFVNIILIGKNESNFLSTIKSRCLILKFENINNKQIREYIEKNSNSVDVPNSIIDAASGSIGKALQLQSKKELYESIQTIINGIENLDLIDMLKQAEIIYKSQDDKYEILDYINVILFEKSKENKQYLKCIDVIEETKKRLQANCNFNMSIDNMLMTIWGEIH